MNENSLEMYYVNVVEWIRDMLANDEIRLKDIPYRIRRTESSIYITALRVSEGISEKRFIGDMRIFADDLSCGNEHMLSAFSAELSVNKYLGSAEFENFKKDISPTVMRKLRERERAVGEKLRDEIGKRDSEKSC